MSIKHIAVATLIMTLGTALAAANSSAATSLKTLYNFCSQGGTNCTDGFQPTGGLVMDKSGNLYGTTSLGGRGRDGNIEGTVFELTPNANNTKWTHKTLYSFCSHSGCTDGTFPEAGLIMDTSGNLYGTTSAGGANPHDQYGGTVFELTPDATKTKWTETVLYSFCAQGGLKCTDGAIPLAGLIMDKSGNLYGTTGYGGLHQPARGVGTGTVFELTLNIATAKWSETVLYSFCAQGGADCTDGQSPEASLIMDGTGRLYGTTSTGGVSPAGIAGQHDERGTVFVLTPQPGKTAWTHNVLYSFCPQGPQNGCPDGAAPVASLIMDAHANLYGTTEFGGAHRGFYDLGGGAAFELTPKGAGGKWVETIIYSFCAQGGKRCTDGAATRAGLIADESGNLYGTTIYGGTHQRLGTLPLGTVFELTPDQTAGTWTETLLQSFCAPNTAHCTAGAFPDGALVMDESSGNLYGLTGYGGANSGPEGNGGGTIFELKP